MTLTLFEAIRVLKPGQEIRWLSPNGAYLIAKWEHGAPEPRSAGLTIQGVNMLDLPVRIIDLPAPEMTPREGLEIACRKLDLDLPCDKCGASDCGNCSKEIARLLFAELSKLNIDWEVK